jgi:hypothetical protein
MSELERAILELQQFDKDVKDGKCRPDPAYRRALLMRIDMLRESEKSKKENDPS